MGLHVRIQGGGGGKKKTKSVGVAESDEVIVNVESGDSSSAADNITVMAEGPAAQTFDEALAMEAATATRRRRALAPDLELEFTKRRLCVGVCVVRFYFYLYLCF